MDRFRPAAGGCVFLQMGGGKWALCLMPTRTADPDRVVRSLAEVPVAPDALVVLNWWDDGFYADVIDRNTILSLEVWQDQAALDAHMAHPHTQGFLARVGGLLDGTPEMAFHQVPDLA